MLNPHACKVQHHWHPLNIHLAVEWSYWIEQIHAHEILSTHYIWTPVLSFIRKEGWDWDWVILVTWGGIYLWICSGALWRRKHLVELKRHCSLILHINCCCFPLLSDFSSRKRTLLKTLHRSAKGTDNSQYGVSALLIEIEWHWWLGGDCQHMNMTKAFHF